MFSQAPTVVGVTSQHTKLFHCQVMTEYHVIDIGVWDFKVTVMCILRPDISHSKSFQYY